MPIQWMHSSCQLNGSGWENYSSRQTIYVLTLIGKQTYIYLLTLNKKRAIRVSRCRFCMKFFPPKPTSTHTYWEKAIRVSRCRFGGINMFGGFYGFVGLSIKLWPEKRYSCLAVGWNVWGFHELGLFWRVPQLNYNWKKRYSCLAISCNVWGAPWAWIVLAGLSLCLFGGFLDQITNYDQKKRYSHLAIRWSVYYVLLTHYTLVDRPSAMMPWGIYPGRRIPALTWGLLVPPARRGLRKDTLVDGWQPRRCWPSYSNIT